MSNTTKIPRRRSRQADADHPVYELDLWLADSQPLIWRSLAVPAGFKLSDLHVVIQVVMGWQECHLHSFETRDRRRFEPVNPLGGVDAMWGMFGDMPETEDEDRTTLRALFDDLKDTLGYCYDFGDNWEHGLKLITTHEDPAAFEHLPNCLDGANAGPPEDCGGVWGYAEHLEILRNPDPEDDWHQQIIEWLGEDFDPEAFDRDAVNRALQAVFAPRPARRSRSGGKQSKRRKRKSR